MPSNLIFSVNKHIGLITLNRQQALNALTHEMITSLNQQLYRWEQDESIHAVVIQAAEGRAFCAGGDIRDLYEMGHKDRTAPMSFFYDEFHLNHHIYNYRKPYIALLDGLTFGGGVGISLHSPYTIATERFVFAMPETAIGFFPDIGAAYLLSRCQDGYGLYLGLTGHRLDVTQAQALGLVRAQIPATQSAAFLSDLIASDLSRNPHQAIEACIHRHQKPIQSVDIPHQTEVKHYFVKPESIKQLWSQLKKSDHPFAKETLQTLSQKSPRSLWVTLEQFKRVPPLSLSACLELDYQLCFYFMQHHDFYEGVRALVIDKDHAPKWQPEEIEKLEDKELADYFSPLPESIPALHLDEKTQKALEAQLS